MYTLFMCIISGKGASLSNTVVYAAEAWKPNHGPVHVLGYENKVKTTGIPGPNAMVLPIPAASPLGPGNVIGGEGLKDVLGMYRKLLAPRSKGVSLGLGRPDSLSRSIVFESGAYTIALASSAEGLRDAVSRVPERKRPEFSDELLESLAQAYPGWPIAICCFNDADFAAASPDPLFWYYEPLDASRLFAPALDAHDGKPPRPGYVERDHTIVFGSYRFENSFNIYRDPYFKTVPEDKQWVVMRNFVGEADMGRRPNGDYVMDLGVLERKLQGKVIGDLLTTAAPPGWSGASGPGVGELLLEKVTGFLRAFRARIVAPRVLGRSGH